VLYFLLLYRLDRVEYFLLHVDRPLLYVYARSLKIYIFIVIKLPSESVSSQELLEKLQRCEMYHEIFMNS